MSGDPFTTYIMPPLTMPASTDEAPNPIELAEQIADEIEDGTVTREQLVEAVRAGRLDIGIAGRAWVMAHQPPPDWPRECPLPDDPMLMHPLIGRSRSGATTQFKMAQRARRREQIEQQAKGKATALAEVREGERITELAQRIGIGYSTLTTWRRRDPEFARQMDDRRGCGRVASFARRGEETRELLLEAVRPGDTMQQVAQRIGVAEGTLRAHRSRHPEFREEFDRRRATDA